MPATRAGSPGAGATRRPATPASAVNARSGAEVRFVPAEGPTDPATNPAADPPTDAAAGSDKADAQVTLYELVGGWPWFEQLVDRFYDRVAEDPVLRPLYPEADLSGARRRLTGFLVQYWGGPDDYSRARGHPRLRMRHHPYPIDT